MQHTKRGSKKRCLRIETVFIWTWQIAGNKRLRLEAGSHKYKPCMQRRLLLLSFTFFYSYAIKDHKRGTERVIAQALIFPLMC